MEKDEAWLPFEEFSTELEQQATWPRTVFEIGKNTHRIDRTEDFRLQDYFLIRLWMHVETMNTL